MQTPNQPYNKSIFWVEVEKVKPNPYQPRREFDEAKLRDLADSIRQYGILQPVVVTRKEVETPEGGLRSEYELIAGERRLRAARLAGVLQMPVIIREDETEEQSEQIKLELAIIENIQREDLSPVDRAYAFKRLAEEFGISVTGIAKRIGKSREFVSNSIRILTLPEEMIQALRDGKISEGHTRPLLMLVGKTEEQITLFKDILYKKLNVREAERISRHVAHERARKKTPDMAPEVLEIERMLATNLGTRVYIEHRGTGGGRVAIDFITTEDLRELLRRLETAASSGILHDESSAPIIAEGLLHENTTLVDGSGEPIAQTPEVSPIEGNFTKEDSDEELYTVKNFTI